MVYFFFVQDRGLETQGSKERVANHWMSFVASDVSGLTFSHDRAFSFSSKSSNVFLMFQNQVIC
jgi:hypothetical protein